MNGVLALVGGAEWQNGCNFDAELLSAAGADEVVVIPTGAAYEHPDSLVDAATHWFSGLGARVRPVMALDRQSAGQPELAATVRDARCIYLAGGSALHLRSVLMQTPLWEALRAAWQSGASVAGTSAGAVVLCDPMVDPRGGAFTIGLGLVTQMALVPHADTWSEEKLHRTLQLAPEGMAIVGVPERTALLRRPDGTWDVSGTETVCVWVDGVDVGLGGLPNGEEPPG